MSRALEDFLARLRGPLGRGPGDPVAPPPAIDRALVDLAPAGVDTVDLFETRAREVELVVHRVAAADLQATVLERCRAHGVRRAAVGVAGARGEDLERALAAADVALVDWRAAGSFEPLYEVDAGITDVAGGVASSGSLVLDAAPDRGRGLSVVPPLHLAILDADRIRRELSDLYAEPLGDPPPAGRVLVTGPSKTADIEGVLVTGVHGPGAVEVLLVV